MAVLWPQHGALIEVDSCGNGDAEGDDQLASNSLLLEPLSEGLAVGSDTFRPRVQEVQDRPAGEELPREVRGKMGRLDLAQHHVATQRRPVAHMCPGDVVCLLRHPVEIGLDGLPESFELADGRGKIVPAAPRVHLEQGRQGFDRGGSTQHHLSIIAHLHHVHLPHL